VQSIQQVASIDGEGLLGSPVFEGFVKCDCVTPDLGSVYPHVVATRLKHGASEFVPQEVQGISECRSCMHGIQLRPKECEEDIPSMEAGRRSGSDVGQECQTLRLGKDPMK
jgi:hypothetical protein